ncbi:MAG: sulfatase-like hydrolase/transferase, partial [Planctomycetaceae bacterium]|nr:sulfatase-like hydrolase/transferase [Planctomycetaceae bacterium]
SYLKKNLPLLEVTQAELDNQPEPLKGLRIHNQEVDHDSVVLELNPTHEQRHRQRAYYLANVTMIDEKIGKILQTLDDKGYLENSIVIFTSDHGDCLTDHGHSQKWTMYDTITRMPLVVWAPGKIPAGKKIEGLCQQMDIGPAILELAGAEVPTGLEARSILPAIKGKDWTPRDYVFAEQAQDGILTDTQFMTMVRSKDWKLVHFLDEPWGQLFNLQNDPKEVNNLWDDPAHLDQKRELLAVLREWRIRSGYETSQWSAQWR